MSSCRASGVHVQPTRMWSRCCFLRQLLFPHLNLPDVSVCAQASSMHSKHTHALCFPTQLQNTHTRGHTLLLLPGDIPLPLKCDEEEQQGPSSSSSLEGRPGSLTTKAPGSVHTRACVNRDRSNLASRGHTNNRV